MKCPFCKRDDESKFRHFKDGKVRCMTCGWKWKNDMTKPHIEKRSTGWGVIFAPGTDEINNTKALKFVGTLNDANDRQYSWGFVARKKHA